MIIIDDHKTFDQPFEIWGHHLVAHLNLGKVTCDGFGLPSNSVGLQNLRFAEDAFFIMGKSALGEST